MVKTWTVIAVIVKDMLLVLSKNGIDGFALSDIKF